jgi:alpha-beta hydrolase superfamily lysophospholipase
MVSFKKKHWNKPFSEKISKRVSRIPSADLTTWADQTLYELGRLLNIYQRVRTPEALKELVISAEAFHAVVEELNRRTNTTL